MSSNYQQGAERAPRKPIINKWEGEGIVHPRSGNDQDQITYYPFPNSGGGAIHISIECTETYTDKNGTPKTSTVYVPVNVLTNKNIQEAQLRTVRPKTKVHVVGKLRLESYNSRKNGEKKTIMVVDATAFNIIALPEEEGAYQNYQNYPGPGGMPQAAPGGWPQGYPAPYGQYPQQGIPQGPGQQPYQQPYYGPQPGVQPYPQPGYVQHYGQQGGAPQGQQGGMPQGPGIPPYYHPPGNGNVQPQVAAPQGQNYGGYPQPAQGPTEVEDDMPPGDPINV